MKSRKKLNLDESYAQCLIQNLLVCSSYLTAVSGQGPQRFVPGTNRLFQVKVYDHGEIVEARRDIHGRVLSMLL